MSHTWTLTVNRMRLAARTPVFLFFSVGMPLALLIGVCGFVAHGRPYLVPYVLSSVLALTVMGTIWGLSMQLVTYREMGILRRFRLAPIGPGALLGSSILSNYFLTLPTVIVQFLLARWLFHMPQWGNLIGVFLMISLGIVTFGSLGLIVASVTNTAQETQMINQALWFIFLFLSGATIPLPTFPGWLQRVALYVPATYLVTGLQRTLVSEESIFHLGPNLLSLVGCSAIALIISHQLFRWDPGSKAPRRAKLWAASTILPFLLLGLWETHYGGLRKDARIDFQYAGHQTSPGAAPH
jgi:ABC-type polysaccharide/polyol phosphate export permease